MLPLIRRLPAAPSRLAALALRRPHRRAATAASTTTTGTPAVSSSRLAGSPPAENPAADQGSELEPRPEPLDRDWGSTLSRADLTEVAGILRRLRDEQISLGLGTFNLLLKRACEADDFLLFAKVFRHLLLSKAAPDLTSYMCVARAIGGLDDNELLLKFVREVLEITNGRDPTVANRIVFAAGRYGRLDKCLIIFEELKKDRRCLDIVTFNTVLDMLGKVGRVGEMLGEVKLMEELGISPDIVTYNTVINCLRRLGRLSLCKSFAREMFERGISPDLRTYTALIDCFGRAGHIADALEAFEQMKKSHQPSIYVYRALISDMKKAGRFELAEKLTDEMNSSASDLLGPEDFRQKSKGRRARNSSR
ncbi:hypothetical protein CFC21_001098 [Triticum aestivum]|uniref:Pentatricopeptide repeat-containing protein n=3 Tax=Triticum TaxID=4564 RepID=A0A9R0UNP3_TRITD|nr:pentatricopeptide repeat-containing protein At1g11900-like [Triticum aestivum]KAF6982750.1 hypothetical protein CFC21_001098 [Triticum aestivum]VAH02567.1 unnamed protein product [Triticum turgidum subsp. durum]